MRKLTLILALLLAGSASADTAGKVAYDKPCVDRFVALAKTIKKTDTKPVVAQKLAELGKPILLPQYPHNAAWTCQKGPGRFSVVFYPGIEGKISFYSIQAEHEERDAFGNVNSVKDVSVYKRFN